jgi:2-methylcitrate dehydratase PrpD
MVQVSGTFQARSGMAINAVASGLDLIGAGVLSSRTPTFGRNSFRGPALITADVRFTWMVPFQGKRVSVYWEVFNLTIRINIQTVDNNWGASRGSPPGDFVGPLMYYPPRQFQIGIHLAS